jgi:hypothetical protein
MHYTGLVQQTDAFKGAAEANQPTAWNDQYMRLMMHFDTGAKPYSWLNKSLFVAKGRLLGTGKIEYIVYRLTSGRLRPSVRFWCALILGDLPQRFDLRGHGPSVIRRGGYLW